MELEDVILLSTVNKRRFLRIGGEGNEKFGIELMTWHQNDVEINL